MPITNLLIYFMIEKTNEELMPEQFTSLTEACRFVPLYIIRWIFFWMLWSLYKTANDRMFFFLPFQECLEFFNIPETQSSHYFLMDKRWNLIHYNKVRQRSGPGDFVLSILSLFKHQGYLKKNKQPINRQNSVLWAPHFGCLVVCSERLEFDSRGKKQKWSPLLLSH